MRAAALTVGVTVILTLLAVPASAAEPRASLPDLEDEVMCPVCGVALGLAESSPQAERIRAFIRRRIGEGRDKEQIKDALVAEFGPDVLAVPEDDDGFNLVGLAVPVGAIAAAAVALGVGLRRWRRQGGTEPGARAGMGPRGSAEPDPAESARLDEDLNRYEL